jgi:hypothetical protein
VFLYATEKEFKVLLYNEWGEKEQGYYNNKKSLLEKQNLQPWIDDSHNQDNMLFTIAEGIRKSHFFIVFLTANFNEKIKRGNVEKEWCFRELNYAAYKLSPKNVIVVVLEEEMTKKSNWADSLLFLFASDVYFDLSAATRNSDGWDYSSIEAWSKLLTKLEECNVKSTTVKEPSLVKDSYTELLTLSTVSPRMEFEVLPLSVDIKESNSDLLVHSVEGNTSSSEVLSNSVEITESEILLHSVDFGEFGSGDGKNTNSEVLVPSIDGNFYGLLLGLGIGMVVSFSLYRRGTFWR